MSELATIESPEYQVARRFVEGCRAPRLRSHYDFTTQEIVIPDGPDVGQMFDVMRQPYTRLLLQERDRGLWSTEVVGGPTQSGKSLIGFCEPIMYHLFELGERVVAGVPNLDIVADKWKDDLLPAIEATEYRDLLPTQGSGSRGGDASTAITFKNGSKLRWMTGGAGDKGRAAFTARVAVITETDGMDEPGKASAEADKITQLIARTRAFTKNTGLVAKVYMECTLTTKEGRTWREWDAGTRSQIYKLCPLCKTFVFPGRDHLVGWQDAETELDAYENSYFACPACSEKWTEDDRRKACEASVLVHRGQEIDAKTGAVTGDLPRTRTLGFRWTGVDNLFTTAGDIGANEWAKQQEESAEKQDNLERELCQFDWGMPHEPDVEDLKTFGVHHILERAIDMPKAVVPSDTEYLTSFMDLGKRICHWGLLALRPNFTPHVVDYGRIYPPWMDMAAELALVIAMDEFKEKCDLGWPCDRELRFPDASWVDSGGGADGVAWADVAYKHCMKSGPTWLPAKGWGTSLNMAGVYTPPQRKGKRSATRHIGDGYHVSRLAAKQTNIVHVDADRWKTFLFERIQTPMGNPGALTLFAAGHRNEHIVFAKHLTAERHERAWVAGKGYVTRWVQIGKENHNLDVFSNCCAAGHYCGARLIGEALPVPQVVKGEWYANQKGRRR